MRIHSESLYLVDNGACLCGDHLGTSASMTGRDISGQPIMELTPDVMDEARSEGIAELFTCERCGKRPSRLYLVG